jgi:hypothetical protein
MQLINIHLPLVHLGIHVYSRWNADPKVSLANEALMHYGPFETLIPVSIGQTQVY